MLNISFPAEVKHHRFTRRSRIGLGAAEAAKIWVQCSLRGIRWTAFAWRETQTSIPS